MALECTSQAKLAFESFVFRCVNAGEDFTIEELVTLTFQPEDVRQPVEFNILGDSIPEDFENFRLTLSIPDQSTPGLRLDRSQSIATINIVDNDGEIVARATHVISGDCNLTITQERERKNSLSLHGYGLCTH